jgi:transposase
MNWSCVIRASAPDCHTLLTPDLPDVALARRTQVWELPPIIVQVTEYQCRTVCCPVCQQLVIGVAPPEAPAAAFGPRLTALIGLLHGRYRHSARETAAFLSEVCGVEVSLGSVMASCTRVSDALSDVDTSIQTAVQAQPHLYVDETGWREQQQRGWLTQRVPAGGQ